MLVSIGGKGKDAPLLIPLEGTSYGFSPIESEKEPSTSTAAYQSSTGQLMELIILSESGDCPDASLRHADGHFHTGDLFQEVETGKYLSQGRKDDWIKSESSLRCDTKYVHTTRIYNIKRGLSLTNSGRSRTTSAILVVNSFSSALSLATAGLLRPCSSRLQISAPWTSRSSRRKSSGKRGNSILAAMSTNGSPPRSTSSSSSVALSPALLPRAMFEDRQLRASTKSCSTASTVPFQHTRLFLPGFGSMYYLCHTAFSRSPQRHLKDLHLTLD